MILYLWLYGLRLRWITITHHLLRSSSWTEMWVVILRLAVIVIRIFAYQELLVAIIAITLTAFGRAELSWVAIRVRSAVRNGALMRCTGFEVVTALADCGKWSQECIRIILPLSLGAISPTSVVLLFRWLIPTTTLIAPAMPRDLFLSSGLIDLTFASPLPSHCRYDDKYDTDEKDDDAEGRERDDYPFLLLALILFIIWIRRLLFTWTIFRARIVFNNVFDIFEK